MDIVKEFIGWFLEHFTSEDISIAQVVLTLGLACINAGYIFVVYRILGRKNIYSKRYSITVSAVLVITTAIIFATFSSVTLSLGVIGALAIVRFRTAIKDALDIVYLFWAVTAGLCYGAHMAEIAIILSATLTILIFYLDDLSVKRGHRLLILESEEADCEEKVIARVEMFAKGYKVRTREWTGKIQKTVIELRTKQEYQLIKEVTKIAGVKSVSLIAQDGEHSY